MGGLVLVENPTVKSKYIVIHFVGDDWKLHSMTLDFVPARGSHTGKAIANVFLNCLKKYESQGKRTLIT